MKGKVLLAVIGVLLLASCHTKTLVVTETHTLHDTTFVSQLQRDSIYLRDSIYNEIIVKGDTVFQTRDRWHIAYRDKHLHDSIYIYITDTVTKPVVVEVKVEKPLSMWQKVKMQTGGVALAIVILGFIGFMVSMIKKK